LDVLKREAAQKTNAAVAEGQNDVHEVKGTGATYLDQAKSVAGSVLASAQQFWNGSTEGQSHPQGSSTGVAAPKTVNTQGKSDDVLASLQSTAGSAIGTTQQYLATAQAAVQPHVENARTTLEPHVVGAKAALQPHVDKAQETAQGYLGIGLGSKSDAVTPPASEKSSRPSTNLPVVAEGTPGSGRPSTTTTVGAEEPKLESKVA
ncbi:hypothetical protein HYDPIDRAFT_104063, partial [Hydnomerulius pinastri MD-312]